MIRRLEDRRVILYEYPFNERIRTYLRLQELFERLSVLMAREDAVDHHFAVMTLFELLEVAARPELKSDVLKDLERQKQTYNSFRGNPAISVDDEHVHAGHFLEITAFAGVQEKGLRAALSAGV